MSHYHLKYFNRLGIGTTNYSASFFSEIEAWHAAGTANATRGADSGYYGIQRCRRGGCRPQAPDFEFKGRSAASSPRTRVAPRSEC